MDPTFSYEAARQSNLDFKLFLSLDMTFVIFPPFARSSALTESQVPFW